MFKVISNKEVGPKIFQLILKYDKLAKDPEPGHFFNIKVSSKNCDDPLLRRPFSIFDFDKQKKQVEFIYRVVGKGTEILSHLKTGSEVDVLGPLGTPFSLKKDKENLHLIGGGMGIAPLYYLAKKLKSKSQSIYLGAANKSELNFFEKKFSDLGVETHLAAVEEKAEIKGTAIDLWLNYLQQERVDFVYSCGPEIMLALVEKKCLENKIEGEISVEKRMGCGIGICLSCSCKSSREKQKNQRACVEGPVFEMGEVVLND